jgi:hypothetical protein
MPLKMGLREDGPVELVSSFEEVVANAISFADLVQAHRNKCPKRRRQESEVGIKNAARPFCILTPDFRLLQHNSVT